MDREIVTRAKAKQLGLKYYYTGKPCKRGHIDERRTTYGGCRQCEREDSNAWKAQNAEHCRQYKRRYSSVPENNQRENARRRANRDNNTRQREKLYRERHYDAVRQWDRNWKAKNWEQRKKESRDYYWANKQERDRVNREYTRLHSKEASLRAANHRAKRRLSEGSYTAQEIENLGKRQSWKCANCRKPIKRQYHKDHVMPIALGGSNYIENIQLLCPTCNHSKSALHPVDWAQRNGRLI